MNNNYMNDEMETVPGEFDAEDMIVMDGVTIDQTTDGGTIDNHYMMADHQIGEDMTSGGDPVDVSADVEEMIKYQDEETTSQFTQHRQGGDNLTSAQTNVNALFEQLKTKFATVNHDMM